MLRFPSERLPVSLPSIGLLPPGPLVMISEVRSLNISNLARCIRPADSSDSRGEVQHGHLPRRFD